ncbi:MAG: hypothetical protein ACREJO_00615 [Phycisphaerales bacterium]
MQLRLRASSNYELVPLERLDSAARAMIQGLNISPGDYGWFRPVAPGLPWRPATQASALIWLTLREAGVFPTFARNDLGVRAAGVASRLVLDAVLEMEIGEAFVCGPEAGSTLLGLGSQAEPSTKIGKLSLQAVHYGARLPIEDDGALSARIYFYNRDPVTPEWTRRLQDRPGLWSFLKLDHSKGKKSVLHGWKEQKGREPVDGWIQWRRESRRQSTSYPFKLYISPATGALPDVLHDTIRALTDAGCPKFKFGGDVFGMLRPDKLVAYFHDRESLLAAGEKLGTKLAGVPPHGVPFSAPMDADGVLSWGMDPPRKQKIVTWRDRESWRLWVTNRLADALLVHRSLRKGASGAVTFALERVRTEGVDTDTWAPANDIWADREQGVPSNGHR